MDSQIAGSARYDMNFEEFHDRNFARNGGGSGEGEGAGGHVGVKGGIGEQSIG